MNTTYNPATWISNTSINDFVRCQKAYFLHNVYKDPKTGHRISLINPYLALGQSVHEVLEELAVLNVEERFTKSLLERYEEVWQKISGKKGGFASDQEEQSFKQRGQSMLQRVMEHPGPLLNKAVRLKITDPSFPLPNFQFSVQDNIILSGKIDWMEYLPETDSVHIIDFKTGKNEEDPTSLQLGIYCLLVKNLQKRNIHKVSYWYLDSENKPTDVEIPDFDETQIKVLEIGQKIKKARSNREFDCIKNGCYACKPYQSIINGQAEFIGTVGYQDLYIEVK